MKGILTSGEERTFCRTYLKTLDPQRAGAAIGQKDGWRFLHNKSICSRLETMRADESAQVTREDVIRRLSELAFGRANDAAVLALALPEERPNPAELDLSAVAELKVTDKGGIEIKFLDRIRALEALGAMLGDSGGGAAEFFQALEDADGEMENT